MNELIHINDNNGKKVVSARELYEQLGFNKTHWAKWYRKNILDNQFAIENEDWTKLALSATASQYQDFALSIDFAKRISMMARTEQGEKIRQYFIEVERKVKELARPMSTLDILKLTIQSMEEQRIELEEVKKDVLQLKAKTTTDSDYVTIMGYAVIKKRNVPRSLAATLGKKAATICKNHNIPMDSMFDPRFGKVRLYPMSILERVFSEAI